MATSSKQTIRAFIAAQPGNAVCVELIRLQRELRTLEQDIRWTSPETMHLTFIFLGQIPALRINSVFQTLEKTAQKFTRFGLELGSLGCFRKAGTVWVGVNAPPELFELQKQLVAGLRMEEKPFQPHLTLGRIKSVRPGIRFFQTLEKLQVEPVSFQINTLYLMQSELLSGGARHTMLGTANLAQ